MKPALVVFIMIIFLVQFLSIHSITLKTRQNFQWGLKSKFNKSLYQSPINIISNSSIITYVKPILMYHAANSSSLYLDPQDNTVKLKAASFGKLVTINNMIFNAEEIQFHTPSEHLINNKQYDMEMHIIHKGISNEDKDKYAVISFLFEKSPGEFNDFIDSLDYLNIGSSSKIIADLNLILPPNFNYSFYTYQGSLTTPPYTNKTIHYVIEDIIPISNTCIEMFKSAIQNKSEFDYLKYVYVNKKLKTNNREIQSLNNRKIYYYNHKNN